MKGSFMAKMDEEVDSRDQVFGEVPSFGYSLSGTDGIIGILVNSRASGRGMEGGSRIQIPDQR